MSRRIVHFVFGLKPQVEPFHLLHYLAIESCRQVVAPDEIRLHVHNLPYGVYWDLARPLVTLNRIEPVAAVETKPVDPVIAPYRYAHHSDVIRLDVLARDGGMYADIDTIFVRPVPDQWWNLDAVIGQEAPVVDPVRGEPEPSVSNALVMARPGASYIERWRAQIIEAMDGSWSGHSCRLATRLAERYPHEVLVVDRECFSPFGHTPEEMRALLEEPAAADVLDQTYSVHLCAHLWWEQTRTDFSTFSAAAATEAHLASASTPLARITRPFLPDHGLF